MVRKQTLLSVTSSSTPVTTSNGESGGSNGGTASSGVATNSGEGTSNGGGNGISPSGGGNQGGGGNVPNTFEGVRVINSTIGNLPDGAAFTIPQRGIYLNKDYWNNSTAAKTRDLLRHEFGHILQYRRYGWAYGLAVAPTSLISAYISAGSGQHKNSWTENEANTLSFLYFGMPKDWNHTEFPISEEYKNGLLKSNNYEIKIR